MAKEGGTDIYAPRDSRAPIAVRIPLSKSKSTQPACPCIVNANAPFAGRPCGDAVQPGVWGFLQTDDLEVTLDLGGRREAFRDAGFIYLDEKYASSYALRIAPFSSYSRAAGIGGPKITLLLLWRDLCKRETFSTIFSAL